MLSVLIAVLTSNLSIAAPLDREILGGWRYVAVEYEGHRYPKTNPNLEVHFEFRPDGIMRLHWVRNDDGSICERLAEYRLQDGNQLYQKVTWVNPKNDSSCATDPDMQMGREMENRVSIKDRELEIFMLLNGQDFIYVLERMDETRQGP